MVNIGIIGAPIDLGADRRGVDMGVSAIRYAGLEQNLRALGHAVRDFGNIAVPIPESVDADHAHLKYLTPIVDMANQLEGQVAAMIDEGYVPLVLGGDHSLSLGSVTGVARRRTIGVIWVDAHGDFNTDESSPSGNIHGMVLSALAGVGAHALVSIGGFSPKVKPQHIAIVGARSLDPEERALLLQYGVHVFTMHDIDRQGLAIIMTRALEQAGAGVDGIHLSLDLDVVDPIQAPGVGTPVRGGLNYRETHLGMEIISQSGKLVSMDLVEVNPVLDNHNQTAGLAMEFALSALGKRIL
jgi:arginase